MPGLRGKRSSIHHLGRGCVGVCMIFPRRPPFRPQAHPVRGFPPPMVSPPLLVHIFPLSDRFDVCQGQQKATPWVRYDHGGASWVVSWVRLTEPRDSLRIPIDLWPPPPVPALRSLLRSLRLCPPCPPDPEPPSRRLLLPPRPCSEITSPTAPSLPTCGAHILSNQFFQK